MKYLLLCFIPLCLCFTTSKTKPFTPPGTVPITEAFFADETEISNFSWQEYELWVKIKYGSHSPQHLAALPDTLVWHNKTAYNDAYAKFYYRHPAYKEYPVVGISYAQAQAFCQWRTERVKEYYSIRYKKELRIEYRLPSKAEWELISQNGTGFFARNGKNEKGEVLFNCSRENDTLLINGSDVTAPIYSFRKNNFGLFNTFGNVAEMTAENGICKGGSWRHGFEDCRAGKDLSYSGPQSWLGFRCVCVVSR